jgi:hypothetical protein
MERAKYNDIVFQSEKDAYSHLQQHFGITVPRAFGDFVIHKTHRKVEADKLVPGILLKYIEGETLDEMYGEDFGPEERLTVWSKMKEHVKTLYAEKTMFANISLSNFLIRDSEVFTEDDLCVMDRRLSTGMRVNFEIICR